MSSEDASADRVAVLVVHGVAAKVPNREFVNLEAITDLLTFQDQAQLQASYRLNQQSTVKFNVNGLPADPTTPTRDAGILYTKMLVNDFEEQPYPYTTRRDELTREPGVNSPKMDVHVHEFFWADLSRPASVTGLHSISAFLRLIYSVCILGPKSLPRESVTQRAGLRGWYRFLYFIQFGISWMTRLYIPIVGTAFLAGIVSLYVLTQTPAAVDTEIPVLAGLSVMIGFAVWCCADSAERKKKPPKKWQKVFHVWTRRVPGWAERRKDWKWLTFFHEWRRWGIIWTLVSVLLAVGWFSLGVKSKWHYGLAQFYVAASFLIGGSLMLAASSHRSMWKSWGSLLALLTLWVIGVVFIGVVYSRMFLAATVFVWTHCFFAAYWLGWLLLCALNLLFWLAGSVCLLRVKKKDFLKHASGLWTACIAGAMPMAMCMVVHLGFFEALCVLLRIKDQKTPHLSGPVFPEDVLRGFSIPSPVNPVVLTKALTYWRACVDHPAIQYLFLFLTLAGALAFCAALPSITAELNPRLRANEDVSDALGAATSQMFDLLRLSGEIVQRYIVVAIPIVVWHVWRHPTPQDHWSPWCGTGIVVLGAAYILSRVYHELTAKTWSGSPAMLIARVFIVLACFALPSFQNEINLTWFSGTSILFILAGVAFLFAPLISVGVDVTSWLQEYPRQSTPRAHILARLIALLDHLKQEGYSGVAIAAHSQGTVIVIEALRYLKWADPDRYKGFPMSLFTLGCPLRQLYAARFPWIYDWVGLTPGKAIKNLKAPPQIVSWTNAYGAGDYVGRNLWHAPSSAFAAEPPDRESRRVTPEEGENRREFCLGAWAHVHYWDWRNLEVAKELDHLIMALKHTPPAPSPVAFVQAKSVDARASVPSRI